MLAVSFESHVITQAQNGVWIILLFDSLGPAQEPVVLLRCSVEAACSLANDIRDAVQRAGDE